MRNKFNALQKIFGRQSPNEEYENFVSAHIKSAAECIRIKLRAKYRVQWVSKQSEKNEITRKRNTLTWLNKDIKCQCSETLKNSKEK